MGISVSPPQGTLALEHGLSTHPEGNAPDSAPQGEKGRTYFAVMYLAGIVEAVGKGRATRFCLRLGEGGAKGDCFPLPKSWRGKPMGTYLGKTCILRIWPRTLPNGTLDPKRPGDFGGLITDPSFVKPPHFQLRGRLVGVDREVGTFQVEIRPNPTGRLKEAFRLTLWASLAFLEGLPPLGHGVYVEGQYRPKSQRLVALQARPMALWDDPA